MSGICVPPSLKCNAADCTKVRKMNAMPIISSAQIANARKALDVLDPALAMANAVTPPFEWRTKPRGFAGLVRLIVEQQVSTASANAIWRRINADLGTVGVEQVAARGIEQMKRLGLSRQKASYIVGIAEAQIEGSIDFGTLGALDDESACVQLMKLKGVGRWTAEAYLIGCEGRTDIFPAGDIALQESVRILDRLSLRPTEKELSARAVIWRPYRSVAAHLLWGYYTGIKLKTIAPPVIATTVPPTTTVDTASPLQIPSGTKAAAGATKGTRKQPAPAIDRAG
jgi:DNA-3-methyladenine glycosylase II